MYIENLAEEKIEVLKAIFVLYEGVYTPMWCAARSDGRRGEKILNHAV